MKAVVIASHPNQGSTFRLIKYTVDFALEQGKDIYVVPGNIDSPNSVGTNDLIKQGAKLLTKVEDILV